MTPDRIIHIFAWVLAAAGVLITLWALFADTSRGRRRCPRCAYSLADIPGRRCPECGHESPTERRLFATRRRWTAAVLGLTLTLVAWLGGSVQSVRRDGWAAAFPTWTLLPLLPLFGGDPEFPFADIAMRPPWHRWERLVIASRMRSFLSERLRQGRLEEPELTPWPDYFQHADALGRELELALDDIVRAAREDSLLRCDLAAVSVSLFPADQRTLALVGWIVAQPDSSETLDYISNAIDIHVSSDAEAVALLAILLKSRDPFFVRESAIGLGARGSAARPVLPALQEALAAATDLRMKDDLQSTIDTIELQR